MDIEMAVYPNPVRDILNVGYATGEARSAELLLMDQSGRLVQRQNLLSSSDLATLQMDVSRYPQGIYFLHLVTDQKRISRKFIKQE
jgi:hypothetical protein